MMFKSSSFRELAKVWSVLFLWYGIGWMLFPTLLDMVAEEIGESLKLTYPALPWVMAAICFVMAGLSFFLILYLPKEERGEDQ
ncbi:MAG: hypothetical protein JSW00_12265 [Thermoplasmata archaeon]|nr:MAG: hypothetical protein JSW00_12265 [Thermoplasmata archaeon]